MVRLKSILELYLSILNLKDIVFELDHNLTKIIQGIWGKCESFVSSNNYISPANSLQLQHPLLHCWHLFPSSQLLMLKLNLAPRDHFHAYIHDLASKWNCHWRHWMLFGRSSTLVAFLFFSHVHERGTNHTNSFLIGKISFKM